MKKIIKLCFFAAALLTISGMITLYNLAGDICSMASHLISGLLPWFNFTISF